MTVLVLALICYVPLLFTAPGKIGADTKAYLYLDPTRLLERAPYLWDEHIGAGTITHQNIGYLFPMGPWYWLFAHVGVPTWIAERLWTGTLLFLAGLGVRALLRTFGWRENAIFVAALGYALTPYAMQYEARTSAILLPYVGLPWMLALSVRALREPRGWRYPALLALIIFTIGGTNATSLVYALVGPLLWLPYAVWVRQEVRLRTALLVTAKAGALTFVVSLWWILGLRAQSAYGLNVLRYTETIRTVSASNNPLEVLRGLGNWYTYGGDRLSPWVEPAQQYMTNPALLVVSYGLPVLALLAAAFLRWSHRLFFAVLTLVGLVIAVGAHPYASPSPLGGLFKAFAENSTAGLALRTTPRAAPLVVLGELVLLAAGLEGLTRRLAARTPRRAASTSRLTSRPRSGLVALPALGVVALLLVDMTPLFQGSLVDKALQAPSSVPDYWKQAVADLDAAGSSTRVLELPGQDFSYYRWGTTADPLTPGLMDRPFVSRELTPYGTPGSAALVRALDRRLQEGVFEPDSVAPVARLLGVGDVLVRSDLQYERFRTPRPRRTWAEFNAATGLGTPRQYGPPALEKPSVPFTDEVTLGVPPGAAEAPSVATFPVTGAQPIVRAERATQPLLYDGDAEGLVDSSAAGVVDGTGPILFGADLSPEQKSQALAAGADLVVTDSARDRAERWGSLRENFGYTVGPGEQPLRKDPTDNRLPVFGDASESGGTGANGGTRTTTTLSGIAAIRATNYGNPLSYVPADRPAGAVDGDPTTAWRVGAFDDIRGEKLELDLTKPVRTDRLTLLQPVTGPRNRFLTRVGVSVNGGPEQSVLLDESSRARPGQTVPIPAQNVRTVTITLHDTNTGLKSQYLGDSGVGFAEVGVGSPATTPTGTEIVTMPTDTLDAAGAASLGHRLLLQMTRERSDPAEPVKLDGELAMQRGFVLPTQRTLSISGTARISAAVPDDQIDGLLGEAGGPTITSSEFLPGSIASRGSAAFDDNPATAWTTPFGQPKGQWVQEAEATPRSVDRMDLKVVADGQHSVPTSVRLVVDGKASKVLPLPAITDSATRGATTAVPLRFPAMTGKTFRVEIASVRPVNTVDFFSRQPQQLPVALAEVGLPGVRAAAAPTQIPSPCRSDLLTVDGKPVPLRIAGSGQDAAARKGLTVEVCGAPLALGPGPHVLKSGEGRSTGIDVDRLVLASDAGGGPAALTPAGVVAPPVLPAADRAVPATTEVHTGPVSSRVSVTGAQPGKPFWLVLGQSQSDGWQATIGGASLGTSRLIDGYANGWLVTPTSSAFTVDLQWTPQRTVWIGIGISAVAVLLCCALAFWPRRRRAAAAMLPGDDELGLRPLRERAPARRPLVAGLSVVALGLLGTLLAGPAAGITVAVVAAIAFFVPYAAALARVLPAGVLAACALYVLQVQVRYRLPADFNWVRNFDRIQPVVWVAPLLLVLVLLLDRPGGFRLSGGGPGSGPDMSEEQPKTVEPTVGGTGGLPGQHAAPATKQVSDDELADTVSGAGTDEGGPATGS